MEFNLNPPDLAVHAGMVGILGFFVKRWINGTARDIKILEDIKQTKEFCLEFRAKCAGLLGERIEQMRIMEEERKEDIEKKFDDFANVREKRFSQVDKKLEELSLDVKVLLQRSVKWQLEHENLKTRAIDSSKL